MRPGQSALPQGQHLSVTPTAPAVRGPGLLQDLASVPKHFVIAKIVPVPCSGPGHRAAAVSLNSVSLPAGLSHLRRNKVGIQGKGKLGKIIAGKRLFFPH